MSTYVYTHVHKVPIFKGYVPELIVLRHFDTQCMRAQNARHTEKRKTAEYPT